MNSRNNDRSNNVAVNGGNNQGSQSNNTGNTGNQQNNEWRLVDNKKKKKAVLGTARPVSAASSSTSKIFGAPPPSRHFVIERVMKDVTKEELLAYITSKNGELEVRSLECMSHEESLYNKFKVEISVEDCKIIYAPDFWPWGTRIRPFFRKRNVDDARPFRRNDIETGD